MSEYVMDYSGWAEGIPAVEYLKVRDAMHARKREEIVRCRDCAKWSFFDTEDGKRMGRAEMSDIATVKIKFTIEQMDELKQLISDVNDAALYDRAQLDERIDALERRIERIEKLLSHKTSKHDSNQEEPGGADELADD